MTVRGVQAPGVRTVTSALRGRVRDDPRTRSEFLSPGHADWMQRMRRPSSLRGGRL